MPAKPPQKPRPWLNDKMADEDLLVNFLARCNRAGTLALSDWRMAETGDDSTVHVDFGNGEIHFDFDKDSNLVGIRVG